LIFLPIISFEKSIRSPFFGYYLSVINFAGSIQEYLLQSEPENDTIIMVIIIFTNKNNALGGLYYE